MGHTINRRTMLKGAGVITVGLPFLEEMCSATAMAAEQATVPVRAFMLKQSRPKDVELFVGMAKLGPTALEELPLKVVVPAFIVSELRTSFQMYWGARKIKAARLRQQHPDWTEEQVQQRVKEIVMHAVT